MRIIDKRKHSEYNTDYKIKDLLKLSKLILEFITLKDEISSKKLYEMISYFYDVKLEAIDYLKYINYKNNTEFNKIISIPTRRVTSDLHREGHGRDFSWWTQNYQRMIKAAAKDFVPENEEYSFGEIEKLIEEGMIYPIYPYGEKTTKPVFNVLDNTKYLVSYQTKELEDKDEYFEYMVQNIVSEIGIKTLIKDVEEFIIKLKLDSFITKDEEYKKFEYVADYLIEKFNKNKKNNQIKTSAIEIVLEYLENLKYEEVWYEKINMEQIIGTISSLDYTKDAEICDEIQNLAINLKEVELCYELALNCDWIDKRTMEEIIIEDGSPEFNYYFASEVEGADVEKHKQVILNSKYSDEYILERTKKL